MYFKYKVRIQGGRGPDFWDSEIELGGEEMTIRQALDQIESELGNDAQVIAIESVED